MIGLGLFLQAQFSLGQTANSLSFDGSNDLVNLGIGDKFSDEFEDLGDADGGFYEDDYSF